MSSACVGCIGVCGADLATLTASLSATFQTKRVYVVGDAAFRASVHGIVSVQRGGRPVIRCTPREFNAVPFAALEDATVLVDGAALASVEGAPHGVTYGKLQIVASEDRFPAPPRVIDADYYRGTYDMFVLCAPFPLDPHAELALADAGAPLHERMRAQPLIRVCDVRSGL